MTQTVEEVMADQTFQAIRDLAERREVVRMEVLSKIKEELEKKDAEGFLEMDLTQEVLSGEDAEKIAAGFLSGAVNACLHLENIHLVRGAGEKV